MAQDPLTFLEMQSQYLLKACKPSTGFQVRAVVHSLPRAMAFWSVTLTTLNLFIWTLGEITGVHERVIYLLVLALATFVLCHWTIPWGLGAILQHFRRKRDGITDVEVGDI